MLKPAVDIHNGQGYFTLVQQLIYMDYNATCPVEPQVLEAMLPYFGKEFGNPSSQGHALGWDADKAVDVARQKVAALVGCQANEIFFTAGSTESNNWAIQGLCDKLRQENANNPLHIVSSPIEHSSVINCLKHVSKSYQAKTTWLGVDSFGCFSIEELQEALSQNAQLACLMWANNEIGSLNPVREIGELCRKSQTYFLCDATQAVGKFKISLADLPIDLMSFSAHKIYGPKGVGALYIRSKEPKVQISPLIFGGGHERGMRSGTLNVPAIVGFGEACAIANGRIEKDFQHLESLRKQFWNKLHELFPSARLNGHPTDRAPNTLNITFKGYTVPGHFAELAVSRGSACHSGSFAASQVLSNIKVTGEEAMQTLRFSLGRHSTLDDIERACQVLKNHVKPILN